MASERTQDQLGSERPEHEVSEEKRPASQADVPGVRGPITSSGEREDAPSGEVETWGSEGGAGTYEGGPVVSDTKLPPGRSGRRPA
ncbi:hypothetical protein SOCEGT47_055370 [Sorangium cellulosum]|jgi:hypothetical protein|uniref:Uncharacterized protein n=1 Tax=Sorangium cellulosum TaxID=56 RepID=A0A4P2Q780_SORCE|nr:hypothetical protein [Sorangium cellulosum]AUX24996.1 hypothetical protein SOCEGT47_055370 [Sorangium cellulosum]